MDDYISRQKVERFIENGLNNPDKKKAFGHDAVEILTEVHYMDSDDVRPVVYCRDCEHCEIWDEDNGIYYCVGGRPGSSVNPAEDFCSKAKRRGAKLGGTDGRQE